MGGHVCSGAASSEEDAVRICTALAESGIVLQFAGLVYLRPMEIAEYIVQARLVMWHMLCLAVTLMPAMLIIA